MAILASFFSSTSGWPLWLTIACVVAAISGVLVSAILELRTPKSVTEFTLSRPDRKGERGIQEYMYRLINQGTNVAIFSRDMSWPDDRLEDLLMRKSVSHSLTLVMPKPTALSDRLKDGGATVCYYGNIYKGVINTRFTLINLERHSTVLAVGRTNDHVHRIERFSDQSDPALLMAEDMFKLIKEIESTVDA